MTWALSACSWSEDCLEPFREERAGVFKPVDVPEQPAVMEEGPGEGGTLQDGVSVEPVKPDVGLEIILVCSKVVGASLLGHPEAGHPGVQPLDSRGP